MLLTFNPLMNIGRLYTIEKNNTICYGQNEIINIISKNTKYPKNLISNVMRSLSDTLDDLLSSTTTNTEIKILHGLKLYAAFLPHDIVKSNLSKTGYMETKDRIKIKARFTDDYKRKVNNSYNKK